MYHHKIDEPKKYYFVPAAVTLFLKVKRVALPYYYHPRDKENSANAVHV